jgi:DNA adenine methylase
MNEQASAWLNAIDGLQEVHDRLKRVVILNRDALDVINGEDSPDTLHYCDPPYLHETRSTTTDYQFEMTETQHLYLLETLASINGKFLLSGYRSALYDEFASQNGWHRHEFDLPNNAASGKTKERKIECVWANYEVKSSPSQV